MEEGEENPQINHLRVVEEDKVAKVTNPKRNGRYLKYLLYLKGQAKAWPLTVTRTPNPEICKFWGRVEALASLKASDLDLLHLETAKWRLHKENLEKCPHLGTHQKCLHMETQLSCLHMETK